MVDSTVFDEFLIDGVLAEQVGIADDEELFLGSGDGYIEFTVDDFTICQSGRYGKYLQLVRLADGGTEDDDVALATLVPLYGVDGDI